MVQCGECGSQRLYRDGLRYLADGETVQRWLCRECGYRFSSGHNGSKAERAYGSNRQICVFDRKAKNLTTATESETVAGKSQQDVKGKILEHLWELRKQGYKPSTIQLRSYMLKSLEKHADLTDPESVKEAIATIGKSDGHKVQLVAAYDTFLSTQGLTWTPPRYRQTQKLPFIPLESELDCLIAAMGRKGAMFLQILKETAARKGEAFSLRWRDVDTERQTVTVNNPEKHSNSRTVKVSGKLIAMLKALPTTSARIFPVGSESYIETHFFTVRKQLAAKLQNPRILNIGFHTFRHWKATMEYHKTKDILHVKQLLGHRNINNTLLYTQLVNFESDDWHAKTAKTIEEACQLVEAGFEYVTEMDGCRLFRKRK